MFAVNPPFFFYYSYTYIYFKNENYIGFFCKKNDVAIFEEKNYIKNYDAIFHIDREILSCVYFFKLCTVYQLINQICSCLSFKCL